MAKDKRCKCTFTQSLVGDGCRYCQPQEYIDMLRDEIKDNQEEYDKLFNEKATIWNLTNNKKEWKGLTDEDLMRLIRKITRERNVKLNKIPFCTLFYDEINKELKEKNT